MLGNYLQQTTLVDVIFRCIFFHGALRVIKIVFPIQQFKHLPMTAAVDTVLVVESGSAE